MEEKPQRLNFYCFFSIYIPKAGFTLPGGSIFFAYQKKSIKLVFQGEDGGKRKGTDT